MLQQQTLHESHQAVSSSQKTRLSTQGRQPTFGAQAFKQETGLPHQGWERSRITSQAEGGHSTQKSLAVPLARFSGCIPPPSETSAAHRHQTSSSSSSLAM